MAGTGIGLGNACVPTADLEARWGLSAGWIEQRSGVRQRYLVDAGQRPTAMAVTAARAALADAGVAPQELDLTICATMTAETTVPPTGCRVVAELGAVPCGSFDLTAACTGMLAGLHLGAASIQSGVYRTVLVVATDILSTVVDWEDPKCAALFGDAASAVVLRRCPDPERGCLYQRLGSDARQWPDLYLPHGPEDLAPGHEPPRVYHTVRMNGRAVFRFAVSTLLEIIPEAVAACGLTLDEIPHFILHQSNLRILDQVQSELQLRDDQVYTNIDRYGNTSAASVGLCLHELRQAGRVKPGDVALFAAVGGGLTWGASVWRV